MNEHLTEQQLIDYAYKLASEDAMQGARVHLESCAPCRRTLDRLQAKLGALELLRGEIEPSDALVARVVEDAAKPRRVAIFRYRHVISMAATAAVFLIGVAWLLHTFSPDRRGEQPSIPESSPQERRLAMTHEARDDSIPEPVDAVDAYTFERTARRPQAPTPSLALAATEPVIDEIDEKPPFAPASAIELVVLPRREDVQLTIYNSADLTLVRERRNLTLKRGWNWLQFMWAETLIDPTSLALEPLEQTDRIEVRQLVFPPRLRELARWLVRSEISGQAPFEITYLTSGLSWRAFYMGTLSQDEKTMHLESYVRVDNRSGEDYEDAQTRLIVGKVHLLDEIAQLARRQHAYGAPESFGRVAGSMGGMGGMGGYGGMRDMYLYWDRPHELQAKTIVKEGLSEYFLYTIEGTETIPNQWGKRLLSFEADAIPVENLYKYDEERYGAETMRFLSFANDTEHNLGETPIPDGMVRIYGQADAQARLSYVGGTNVTYIPVGEKVEVNLGPARLVKVEPTLMQTATSNYVFDSNDNPTGWDEAQTWQVEVTNTRTLPVEVEITRGFDSPYWTLTMDDAAVAYARHDVTRALFTLRLEPRSKRTFRYTVTHHRGRRSAFYIRQQAEAGQ